MKPIVLKRTVRVRTFETIATIAIPEHRPDLLAVAHMAAQRERVGGRDIGRDLLGMNDSLGWRVLERCQRLGLLDRDESSGPFRLTELGRHAVSSERVFLPERGAYRFAWVEDPLLPEALLGWTVLDPADHEERKKLEKETRERAKASKQGQGIASVGSPASLRELRGRVTTALEDGAQVRVLELGDGFVDKEDPLELALVLAPDDVPRLRISGRRGGRRYSRELAAGDRVEQDYPAVWKHILDQAIHPEPWQLSAWFSNFGAGTVGRSFDDATPIVRETFEERLSVPEVVLEGAGRFDGVSLRCAVAPDSAEDAHQWAMWLVWHGLVDHLSREALEQHLEAVRARFPHHDVELPASEALLQQARQRLREDPRAWRLVAPADLGLWGVTHG